MSKFRFDYVCFVVFTIMDVLILAEHETYTTDNGQLAQSVRSWLDNLTAVVENNLSVEIKIQHETLDVSKGYIANVSYLVTLSSHNESYQPTVPAQLVSVSSSSRTPIGGFSQVTNDNGVPSNQSRNPISCTSSADVNDTLIAVNTVEWMSPEVASGCITFVLFAEKERTATILSTKELCPREGCIHRLTSIKGKVHSPDYPANYPDNSNCLIIIEVPQEYRIKIQFQAFHLESAYQGECVDYVTISSSEQISTTELVMTSPRQICGHYIEEDLKQLSFISDQNIFIIHFRSDNKLSGSGFIAVYYAVDRTGQPPACSKMVAVDQMTINSPYYPDVYVPNLHCTVRLTVDDGLTILLKIVRMKLEAARDNICPDYLVVEGAMEEPTHHCGSYSEECELPLVYESTSSNLTLTFHSDFIRQASGFEAVYTTVAACSDVVVSELNGTLTSSNYPLAYPNHQNCTTVINVTEPWLDIQLQVLRLDTEIEFGTYGSGNVCSTDYLEVFDGGKSWRKCGRWSGREYLLKFRSEGPTMSVRFVSDGSRHGIGYEARWQAVVNDSALITCSGDWLGFNDYCLWIADDRVTWQEAADLCHQNDSYLATINNRNIHRFISDSLRGRHTHTDAFWIGANDRIYEADFYWDNGVKLEYEGWFPGWSQYNFYNKQPNDDGLSNEDCVEIRNWFSFPSKGGASVDLYYWNDRSCDARNGYICQKLKPELLPLVRQHQPDCSSHIMLSRSRRRGILSSPGYPLLYDNFLSCNMTIEVPEHYVIQLEFSDFVLENDGQCRYDFVKIASLSIQDGVEERVSRDKLYCGDWSGKTKLLRYVSLTSVLKLTFVTDHSRVFRGFKAKYEMIEPPQPCGSGWYYVMEIDTCFSVGDDDVMMTYHDAEDYCYSVEAELLSQQTHNDSVKTLLTSYTNVSLAASYWTSTYHNETRDLLTSSRINFTNLDFSHMITREDRMQPSCLVYRIEDGLQLITVNCNDLANVICQKSPSSATKFFLNDTSGTIRVPDTGNGTYRNNMHLLWHITAPPGHRLLIKIDRMDIEPQADCLYDYLLISDLGEDTNKSSHSRRLCGQTNFSSDWSLSANAAEVEFVSDYVTTGAGFVLEWEAIQVASVYVYDQDRGVIASLNYPRHYLDNLHYDIIIQVPEHRRVFLRFLTFDLFSEDCRDFLDLDLGTGSVRRLCARLGRSEFCRRRFISRRNRAVMSFQSDSNGHAAGFKLEYESVPSYGWQIEEELHVKESTDVLLCAMNFPDPQPAGVVTTYHLRSELGRQIKVSASVQENCLNIAPSSGQEEDYITLHDRYIPDGPLSSTFYIGSCFNATSPTESSRKSTFSYLNYLTLSFHSAVQTRQASLLSVDVESVADVEFLNKTKAQLNISVDTCTPSPCYHGATCYKHDRADWYSCQCYGHYTGLLCAWSYCDVDDQCQNGGFCTNTETSFNCSCHQQYSGRHCEVSLNSCALEYCLGHGRCVFDEKWQKFCECDHGRIGPRCASSLPVTEVKRSLSARLLDEPFWIGIIVVALLSVITCVVVLIRRKCHCREKCQSGSGKDMNSTQETNGMKSVFRRYRTGKKYEKSVNGILNQVYSTMSSVSTDPSRFMMATAAIASHDKVQVRPTCSDATKQNNRTEGGVAADDDVDNKQMMSANGSSSHVTSEEVETGVANDDRDYLKPISIVPYLSGSSESENEIPPPDIYPEAVDLSSGHRLFVISNDRHSRTSLNSNDTSGNVAPSEPVVHQMAPADGRENESSTRAGGALRRLDFANSARCGRRDVVASDQESCQSSEGSAYYSCGSACSLSRCSSYQTINADSSCPHRMPHSISYTSLDYLSCLPPHAYDSYERELANRDREAAYDSGTRTSRRHRHYHQQHQHYRHHRHHYQSADQAKRHRKHRANRRKNNDDERRLDEEHSSRKQREISSRSKNGRREDIAEGTVSLSHYSRHYASVSGDCKRPKALSFSRDDDHEGGSHFDDTHKPPPPTPALVESGTELVVEPNEAASPFYPHSADGDAMDSLSLARAISPAGSSSEHLSQDVAAGSSSLSSVKSGMEARRDSFLNILDADLCAADSTTPRALGSFNPLASSAELLDVDAIDPSASIDSAVSVNSNVSDNCRTADSEQTILSDVNEITVSDPPWPSNPVPEECPPKDSAYQSKDVSTEPYVSSSRSNPVSPTPATNCPVLDTIDYDAYKATPYREEDKRVTNQLELAARKLQALSDENFNEELGYRPQYQRLESVDRQILDNRNATYPSQVVSGVSGVQNKIRRTFPSRVLSMIMDEETESTSETSVAADPDLTDLALNQGSEPLDEAIRPYRSPPEVSTIHDNDDDDDDVDLPVFYEVKTPITLCQTEQQSEV